MGAQAKGGQVNITTTIRNCARCGGTHQGLEFKPFTRHPSRDALGESFPIYTHWAMCPDIKEPVLMYMTDTDRPVAGDM